MRKTYKKKKPEINTQKLKINPKNKAQKSMTKSSRDLREKYQKKKKINTNKISRSRRLRKNDKKKNSKILTKKSQDPED
jgi:hypothetical protein